MAADKRMKALIRELEAQGFRVQATKAGWMIWPPNLDRNGVAIHRTPGDYRAWANMLARLKKVGFDPRN